MKRCDKCKKGNLVEKTERDKNGIAFHYFACATCRNSFLDMDQLHAVAEKYRAMKKYRVKLTRWGVSKGIRIPKELLAKYKFSKEVSLIPEKDCIRLVP